MPPPCVPLTFNQHHDPMHEHGPGCGHAAVPHGDHTDYLVDGALHHWHGDHCDHHGRAAVGALAPAKA
ncbi:MAG: hypothetical protein ACPGQL_00665 [Thermoplasmatota archaeon]